LRRLEWNRRFFTALRANGLRLDALHSRGSGCADSTLRARRLARFAPFRLVLEAFIGEEHLFAGGKDKLRTAFGALQYLIVEFHGSLRAVAWRRPKNGAPPLIDDAENE
jgi:hypothetical protein